MVCEGKMMTLLCDRTRGARCLGVGCWAIECLVPGWFMLHACGDVAVVAYFSYYRDGLCYLSPCDAFLGC